METFVTNLMSLFLTYQNALVMLGTWGVIEIVARSFPKLLTPLVVRMLPLASLVICAGAVWIPGVVASDVTPAIRVFLGLNLGAWSGYLYKIFKQTILGKDSRIGSLIDSTAVPVVPVVPATPGTPVSSTEITKP